MDAADLWRNTLSQIPNTFGRLTYLASLRDSNTGTYRHHGLEQLFGHDMTNQTLRASHDETFLEWSGFTVDQQKRDIADYLNDVEADKTVLAALLRLSPHGTFIPASARD